MKKKIVLKLFFVILILPLAIVSNAQWNQVGTDIDGGTCNNSEAGHSVSLNSDGNIVAIGAFKYDGLGSESGHVRVYEHSDGSGWVQLGNDIIGEASGDWSGYSVSLNAEGDVVAIGAVHNDGTGNSNCGHVRIYRFDGVNWDQVGDDIDGSEVDDYFGWSVSLNTEGNIVAIGAYHHDGCPAKGHAKIFKYNPDIPAWEQLGSDIDGVYNGDEAGWSVSLDSDGYTVAIGSPGNTNISGGAASGHVRVFSFNGTNWIQLGDAINGTGAGDQSGRYVSLSKDGKVVAIGAPSNDDNGTDAGQVRVYRYTTRTTPNRWSKIGNNINGESVEDYSGVVSIANDPSYPLKNLGLIVAIGAPGSNDNGINSGHTRIFQYTSTGWAQKGTDIIGEAAYDRSGSSVSLNSVGNRVAIGAPNNDCNLGIGYNYGHTRVFEYVNLIKTNIHELPNTKCQVYPNPTNGMVNIHGNNIQNVQIYNASGQVILYATNSRVDLSEQPNGLYFIKVTTEKESFMLKLIKE